MPVESPICYLNGSYLPLCDASIPLEDLAILRGYVVFEFLRTYSGIVFEPESHFERLHHSASKIGMSIPWTNAELLSIITETVARNRFAEVGIRLIITGGRSADGKHADGQPSLAVIVKALLRPSAAEFAAGVKAITIRLTKDFPTAKSISYAGALMALGRAEQAGAQEALYLGENDVILEGTTVNFFAVCEGILRTAHDTIVAGITRQIILDLAQDLLPVGGPVKLHELPTVSEAFVTSTSREVIPVTEIDSLQLSDGEPGPITRELRARFQAHLSTSQL